MSAQLDGAAWFVNATALVAAIDLELAELDATYAALVGKGRMHAEEADWRSGVLRDIREDLTFAFAPISDGEIRETWQRSGRVTWQNKVRWIERELDDRRERFPGLVAKGRLTEAEAGRRIGAIAELRRLYWERMFQWEPPDEQARAYLAARRNAALSEASTALLSRSEGARLYRECVRAHMALLDQERDDAQGQLVA